MHLSTLGVLIALSVIASLTTVEARRPNRFSVNDIRYGRYSSNLKRWIYNTWSYYKGLYIRRNRIRSNNSKKMMTYVNKEVLKNRFRNFANFIRNELNKLRHKARKRDYKRFALEAAKDLRREIESYYKLVIKRKIKIGRFHKKLMRTPVSKLDTTLHAV